MSKNLLFCTWTFWLGYTDYPTGYAGKLGAGTKNHMCSASVVQHRSSLLLSKEASIIQTTSCLNPKPY